MDHVIITIIVRCISPPHIQVPIRHFINMICTWTIGIVVGHSYLKTSCHFFNPKYSLILGIHSNGMVTK